MITNNIIIIIHKYNFVQIVQPVSNLNNSLFVLLRDIRPVYCVRNKRNPWYSLWANAKYFNVRVRGTYRPYFVKRGQPTKHQLYRRSKIYRVSRNFPLYCKEKQLNPVITTSVYTTPRL